MKADHGSLGARLMLLAAIGLGLAATGVLVLGESLKWMRLGVVAALWAALAGAFLAARYRRQVAERTEDAESLQKVYELELEREVTARREYELEVTAEAKAGAEAAARDDLAELRGELRSLREHLENLLGGGELLVERIALRAEATRMRSQENRAIPTGAPLRRISGTRDPRTEMMDRVPPQDWYIDGRQIDPNWTPSWETGEQPVIRDISTAPRPHFPAQAGRDQADRSRPQTRPAPPRRGPEVSQQLRPVDRRTAHPDARPAQPPDFRAAQPMDARAAHPAETRQPHAADARPAHPTEARPANQAEGRQPHAADAHQADGRQQHPTDARAAHPAEARQPRPADARPGGVAESRPPHPTEARPIDQTDVRAAAAVERPAPPAEPRAAGPVRQPQAQPDPRVQGPMPARQAPPRPGHETDVRPVEPRPMAAQARPGPESSQRFAAVADAPGDRQAPADPRPFDDAAPETESVGKRRAPTGVFPPVAAAAAIAGMRAAKAESSGFHQPVRPAAPGAAEPAAAHRAPSGYYAPVRPPAAGRRAKPDEDTGGRRRRAEDAPAWQETETPAGSHTQGTSVRDLLAAHGTTPSRRRRRRDED